MAPSISVRNCIKPEDRAFLSKPGVAEVVDRIDRALQEPLRSSAEKFEMPHSVIEDCGIQETHQALFLMGLSVEYAVRTKDGQVHTRGEFSKLLRESALEIKTGAPPVASEASVFLLAHLNVIRKASRPIVDLPAQDTPDDAPRRRFKP
jgi:hypothetical protein